MDRSTQPNVTRIPPEQRAQYDWPVGTRAVWAKGDNHRGFGDIVRVNRRTLELTDGKFGGENMLIGKELVYELVNF